MNMLNGKLCLAGAALLVATALHAQDEPAPRPMPPVAEVTIDYDTHIKPLMDKACLECHNEKKKKSKLRLDTRELVLQGGIEGPSVIIGDSANSHLVTILLGAMEDYEPMPPADDYDPFTDEEIGLIRAWIDQGLVFGADASGTHPAEAAVPGLPEDWKAQAANQAGPLATWGLIQDFKGPDGEQLIGLTAHEAPNADTLNLLWTPKADFQDGGISLKIKATGGAKSAGVAWRIKDKDNYYAALVDWPAKKLSVVVVQGGKSTELGNATQGADLEEWVSLKINQTGGTAIVESDLGTTTVNDDSLPDAGGVGYITAGDSTAGFTAFKKE